MALTQFLRQRLAEDTTRAEVAVAFLASLRHRPGGWSVEGLTVWDARRTVANLDAKHRIVDMYDRSTTAHQAITLLPVLRLLALPYADHPDYEETWRP